MGRSNNRNITSKNKRYKWRDIIWFTIKSKNISLKENITDVTVTVKNGAGKEKEYIVRIQKRQPAITGKVITQASDQANQTATIKVYKTSDTRNENDADNPRELIKKLR